MSVGFENDVSARLSGIEHIIDAEFDEMPGLRLTLSQARRLWHLSPEACELALEQLCRLGLLTRDLTGHYLRRRVEA
jgi:hypothetical protein